MSPKQGLPLLSTGLLGGGEPGSTARVPRRCHMAPPLGDFLHPVFPERVSVPSTVSLPLPGDRGSSDRRYHSGRERATETWPLLRRASPRSVCQGCSAASCILRPDSAHAHLHGALGRGRPSCGARPAPCRTCRLGKAAAIARRAASLRTPPRLRGADASAGANSQVQRTHRAANKAHPRVPHRSRGTAHRASWHGPGDPQDLRPADGIVGAKVCTWPFLTLTRIRICGRLGRRLQKVLSYGGRHGPGSKASGSQQGQSGDIKLVL